MACRHHHSLYTDSDESDDDSWAYTERHNGYSSDSDDSRDGYEHDGSHDCGDDGGSGDEEVGYHEGGQCGRKCCGEPNSEDDEKEYHSRKLCGPTCHGTPSQADANARAWFDAAVAAAKVAPGTVDEAVFTDAYLQQLLVSFKRRHAQFCRYRPHYREGQLVPGLVWTKVHEDFESKFPGANFDSLLLKTHLRRALYASDPPNYYSYSEREYYKQPAPAPGPASAPQVPIALAPAALAPVAPLPPVVHAPLSTAQAVALVNERAARFATAQAPITPAVRLSQASTNQTQAIATGITSEQIDPAAASMEASVAAFVEQVDLGSEFPLNGGSDHSATDTASSDTEEEANEEASNPQSSSQEESQKRRRLENTVELQELKKRKLALENLKLAMDLGIITREESIEKGRLLVQTSATTPSDQEPR